MTRRLLAGIAVVAMALAAASCSHTAGPVRPEPSIGLPADPTTLPDSARRAPAPAPTPAPAARPVPPIEPPDEPPEDRPPPTRLPGSAGIGATPSSGAIRRLPASVGGATVRVLTGTHRDAVSFEGSEGWVVTREGDRTPVARGAAGRAWRIEQQGTALRVVRSDGAATPSTSGVLELRSATDGAVLTVEGRRYRGAIRFHATTNGLLAVNHVPLEAYLLGVVPLEIGRDRTAAEMAAVEAQAVAARSYAVTRLGAGGAFDLRSTTADQVYGGVAAETAIATQAVLNTRGLVLQYRGRPVDAPYHSTCGGTTAAAEEVWQSGGEPYLQRVSDRIPGTERDYCAPSPRYRWTKTISAADLDEAVARHLATYRPEAGRQPGAVRAVRIASRTASGRVGTVTIETARGSYALRGNDARWVLRKPGGEILNSPYFSVRGPADARGGIVLEGRGYGHGVGMCQWGAIGRARAGQDFRTILGAYFPGTTVGPVR